MNPEPRRSYMDTLQQQAGRPERITLPSRNILHALGMHEVGVRVPLPKQFQPVPEIVITPPQ